MLVLNLNWPFRKRDAGKQWDSIVLVSGQVFRRPPIAMLNRSTPLHYMEMQSKTHLVTSYLHISK